MNCKHCESTHYVKAGKIRGKQRYQCKNCCRHFTDTPSPGKPLAMKALAVLLYAVGNASLGMIARLLKVSNVAVLKWVRKEAQKIQEPPIPEDLEIVQIDEMWHFVNGKRNKVWIWKAFDPITKQTLTFEIGGHDDATLKKLLNKIGLENKVFVTDEWGGFYRLIPEENLFTGKDLTVHIEQDNSNTRHYLARFRRKSKVTSRSVEMVKLSLLLLQHVSIPANFTYYQEILLSIFG